MQRSAVPGRSGRAGTCASCHSGRAMVRASHHSSKQPIRASGAEIPTTFQHQGRLSGIMVCASGCCATTPQPALGTVAKPADHLHTLAVGQLAGAVAQVGQLVDQLIALHDGTHPLAVGVVEQPAIAVDHIQVPNRPCRSARRSQAMRMLCSRR